MAAPIPRSAAGEVTAAPIRVIQWATGSIGTHAIPAILEDPGLELVGVKVYSEAKEGKDAGTLVGIDPIGLEATRDVDALIALDADCVLYAPLLADVGEHLLRGIAEPGPHPRSFRPIAPAPELMAPLGNRCSG